MIAAGSINALPNPFARGAKPAISTFKVPPSLPFIAISLAISRMAVLDSSIASVINPDSIPIDFIPD